MVTASNPPKRVCPSSSSVSLAARNNASNKHPTLSQRQKVFLLEVAPVRSDEISYLETRPPGRCRAMGHAVCSGGLGQPIERTLCFRNQRCADSGIARGGLDIVVAEQDLDHSQVGALSSSSVAKL